MRDAGRTPALPPTRRLVMSTPNSATLLSDLPGAAEEPGVGRMLPPTGVVPWRLNWAYLITFLVMHGLALLALSPWFFSWSGLALFVLASILFGQFAIPIGYHRLLTHRSFRTPRWFERTLVTLAMCAGQETPARWVAWHRLHHLHSDHREDPHSPLVSFFWSHMNWLVHETAGNMKTFALYERYARDVLKDPYYLWLERLPIANSLVFMIHAVLWFMASWLVAVLTLGAGTPALQWALSLFLWGVVVRTVAVWHITWSVNSLTHLFGYRNFDTPDGSRNNWLVALLASGEGWHNNHHADQVSATVWIKWWEFDLNYCVIRLLGLVGLATDIVPPRHVRERLREAVAGRVSPEKPVGN